MTSHHTPEMHPPDRVTVDFETFVGLNALARELFDRRGLADLAIDEAYELLDLVFHSLHEAGELSGHLKGEVRDDSEQRVVVDSTNDGAAAFAGVVANAAVQKYASGELFIVVTDKNAPNDSAPAVLETLHFTA